MIVTCIKSAKGFMSSVTVIYKVTNYKTELPNYNLIILYKEIISGAVILLSTGLLKCPLKIGCICQLQFHSVPNFISSCFHISLMVFLRIKCVYVFTFVSPNVYIYVFYFLYVHVHIHITVSYVFRHAYCWRSLN